MRKRGYLYKYAELAQKVLGSLLDKYADEGIRDIEDAKVLQLTVSASPSFSSTAQFLHLHPSGIIDL